jgi:hypothetical protein
VLLAVLMTSARYGGREAWLGIDDLVRMTGLASRTVKAALGALIDRKLVTRVGRYRRLVINLGIGVVASKGGESPASPFEASADEGGAHKIVPPAGNRRGADKLAPPRCKLARTSPTSVYLSSKNKEEYRRGTFTPKQDILISDVLTEASELLGSDAASLSLPDTVAASLGLTTPVTYAEAFVLVGRSGDRTKARDFTRAVLMLRRDERVQGQELPASSANFRTHAVKKTRHQGASP